MFGNLFHTVLYQPIFNIFIGLYDIIPYHDLGVVILIITVIIRLALYPLTSAALKSQKSLQEMQPKLEEIKRLYATDKQKQAEATMQLYKNNKVNPFASCLPLLIQLPILIALFWVLRDGLASSNLAQNLYSFVPNPGKVNPISFGIFDLSKASYVLAVLAGVAQFVQTKMMSQKHPPKEAEPGKGAKDEDMLAAMNKQMMYTMPIVTVLIGIRFPAGLTLYWFLTTALMVLQQYILFHRQDKTPPSQPSVIEGTIVK